MRDFRKLEIWKKGMTIVINTYKATANMPGEEKFGLTSQMRRAAVSMPSNIAEGCSRNSQKEYKRYLEISLGSSFELETQVLLCQALNYFDKQQADSLVTELHYFQKQTNTLITKIKNTLK